MVYDKLLEILKEVKPNTDVSKITMESNLSTDLRIDSLSMMLLAINIEEAYNIRFDGNPDFKTVADICQFVEDKIK